MLKLNLKPNYYPQVTGEIGKYDALEDYSVVYRVSKLSFENLCPSILKYVGVLEQ